MGPMGPLAYSFCFCSGGASGHTHIFSGRLICHWLVSIDVSKQLLVHVRQPEYLPIISLGPFPSNVLLSFCPSGDHRVPLCMAQEMLNTGLEKYIGKPKGGKTHLKNTYTELTNNLQANRTDSCNLLQTSLEDRSLQIGLKTSL